MANLSNVDADKIRSTASKLADTVADIISQVNKINDAMMSLDNGWKSEVKAQFMENWFEDSEALIEMMEQYEEVDTLLEEAAQNFEKNEEEMIAEVGKLK